MRSDFRLGLPGIDFTVRSERGIEIVEDHPLYRDFLGKHDHNRRISRSPSRSSSTNPDLTRRGRLFSTAETVGSPTAMIPISYSLSDRARMPGAYWWLARLTPADPKVTVLCDPEVIERTPALTRIANPIHYPLDQLLTMMLLANRGGCIVHAAGVHCDGKGIACIGRSGAGKTTLMGLLDTPRSPPAERRSADPARRTSRPWFRNAMGRRRHGRRQLHR